MAFVGILDNEYLPSASVVVPRVVPFTITVTPGNEAPEESVTFPDIDFCCWLFNPELPSRLERIICLFTTEYLISVPFSNSSKITVIVWDFALMFTV